jgi:hypothetical protein
MNSAYNSQAQHGNLRDELGLATTLERCMTFFAEIDTSLPQKNKAKVAEISTMYGRSPSQVMRRVRTGDCHKTNTIGITT